MFNRTIEKSQEETFSNIDSARIYSEQAEKSSKMRYRGFLTEINKLRMNGDYLDVGAGSGIVATMIADQNKNISITALELSPTMVELGNEIVDKKELQSQIKFVNGNIDDSELAKKLGKFDVVYSTFSLHHWEYPKKAITNLLNYVKDDGLLIIYDLRRVWWLHWIPKNTGFFNSIRASYKPIELRKLLNDVNISKYRIRTFFPFFLQNITIWKK
jgi:2-polyprenyl-3-methyl-5-hydroxy-6-metoxy-1,4-benzoquinol methylase